MCLLEMFNSITWEHCILWQMPIVPLMDWTIHTDTHSQYTCVYTTTHTPGAHSYPHVLLLGKNHPRCSKGCPLQLHQPSSSTVGRANACNPVKVVWAQTHAHMDNGQSAVVMCQRQQRSHPGHCNQGASCPACPLSTHHPTKQNYLNRFLDFDGFSWLVDPLV